MKQNTESKAYTKQTAQIFWQHAWQYPSYVIGLFVGVPLAILTFRYLPSLVVAAILARISRGDFTQGNVWASFGPQLLIYSGLVILGGIIFWRINVILIWQLEMRVLRDIHQRIFAHFMSLSASFHSDRFGGSLVSQANKFASSYVRLADSIVFQTIGLICSFLFSFVILIHRAPLVVAFLFVFSAAYIVMSIKITRTIRQLNAVEATASNRQTGFLADAITNIMAVKSFASHAYEQTRYGEATQATYDATHRLMKGSIKRDIAFSSATSILSIGSLLAAIVGVVTFHSDVSTTYLVVTYAAIISENLWDFSQSTLKNFNRAFGDAQDMTQILGLKPDVVDADHLLEAHIQRGAIRFENVGFAYSENKHDRLFDGLSLAIKPGEKIGLVGLSGSGKTSLTKLLLRFSDITSGKILVDGYDISQISQDDLRSRIAYVPQEPLLFHRSLLENIQYGNPGASQREVTAIAKLAHADDFIQKLPQGYATLVGERGVKLSGGQRQRIAIARAMLKNAPILVLDEATSALDSESELLIQDALWKLMEGRTAIVIAHRLSTIQKMDRIIVLDNGSIIEQGSHRELIHAGGSYASLWSHQSGGFIED